jgi:plasmid stabilization system protein ParE
MIYRVILSPDAKEGIRSARLWYLQHDTDLPLRFSTDLKVTFDRMAQNPYHFPVVADRLRRAILRRFPYSVFFTVLEKRIYVLAVSHQRRLNPLRRP